MPLFGASLADDSRVVIYNRKMLIIQATGCIFKTLSSMCFIFVYKYVVMLSVFLLNIVLLSYTFFLNAMSVFMLNVVLLNAVMYISFCRLTLCRVSLLTDFSSPDSTTRPPLLPWATSTTPASPNSSTSSPPALHTGGHCYTTFFPSSDALWHML